MCKRRVGQSSDYKEHVYQSVDFETFELLLAVEPDENQMNRLPLAVSSGPHVFHFLTFSILPKIPNYSKAKLQTKIPPFLNIHKIFNKQRLPPAPVPNHPPLQP